MPTLELDLEADLLSKIECAARKENLSVSGWIASRLSGSLDNLSALDKVSAAWGKLDDPEFQAPERPGADEHRPVPDLDES